MNEKNKELLARLTEKRKDDIPWKLSEIEKMKYNKDKPYVFLSYSHNNSIKVVDIFNNLNKMGCNVWLDKANLPVGRTSWEENAKAAIRKCNAFIFFRSENSLVSENILTEIKQAFLRETKLEELSKNFGFMVVDLLEEGNTAESYLAQLDSLIYDLDVLKEEDKKAETDFKLANKAHAIGTEINKIISTEANAIQQGNEGLQEIVEKIAHELELYGISDEKVTTADVILPSKAKAKPKYPSQKVIDRTPAEKQTAATIAPPPVSHPTSTEPGTTTGTFCVTPSTTLAQFRKMTESTDFCNQLRALREDPTLFPRQKSFFDYAMVSVLGGCNAMSHLYQNQYYTWVVADPNKAKDTEKKGADWTWSSNVRRVVRGDSTVKKIETDKSGNPKESEYLVLGGKEIGKLGSGRLFKEFNDPFEIISDDSTLSTIRQNFVNGDPVEYHSKNNEAVVKVFDTLFEKFNN